jgi:nitrite reductase/ring-hydroxylating ferredoxin subunit
MCAHDHDTSTAGGASAPLDRRSFLRNAALFAAGALVAQGLTPDAALAERASFIQPLTSTVRERTYTLPQLDGVSVDEAERLVLVRSHNRLYAFSLECPHRGRMLEWQPGGSQFYCPKHKARFSTDGTNIGGRRTSALDRYALRRDGARVIVSLDLVLSFTDAPAEWKAAALSV